MFQRRVSGLGGPAVPLRCDSLLGLRLHLCGIQETRDSSEHLYRSPWEELWGMFWRCCGLGLGHVRGGELWTRVQEPVHWAQP